ncbi:hypothetical protein RvY_08405-2 [Ramazzottius varieornatus]|uniref:Kinesin-like protein unc-104 n=1 Tax=Ramazzottius varieornatus TaxID=947166 RepID=A0A1D1V5R2_RAMVA|nr:hypothetical protein RvY_08405-2 [Ramazzottius varieornatus]
MIAAISPADINFDETMSTLRYANHAKSIVCAAVVNEDPNARLIRELREEVEELRRQLKEEGLKLGHSAADQPAGGAAPRTRNQSESAQDAMERLKESEKLIAELNETWEEKLRRTEEVKVQRENMLQEMGLAVKDDGITVGVFGPKKLPHLVNLNEDPGMSECLFYYIREGKTRLGSDKSQDIQLSGGSIQSEHCVFTYGNDEVTIEPCGDAETYVNAKRIDGPTALRNGSRLLIGTHHLFRFANPLQSRFHDKDFRSPMSDTPGGEKADWSFAQAELLNKQGIDLKGDMERRLVALEEQYRKEKQESDKMFAEVRKGYETTIDSLKRQVDTMQQSIMSGSMFSSYTTPDRDFDDFGLPCLWSKEEQRVAKIVWDKWRTHQFTSLRDQLWGNMVFLKEANAISVELKKKVQFQYALISETLYSPLPPDFLLEGKQQNKKSRIYVAVEVRDLKNGATHYWSLDKFKQRLELMRHMYANDAELSPTSPDITMESMAGEDPFHDRFPWFKLIGRGFIQLTNLQDPISLGHKVAIVNDAGEVKGHLHVVVQPATTKDDDIPDFIPGVRQSARIRFSESDVVIEKKTSLLSNGPSLELEEDVFDQHAGAQPANGPKVTSNSSTRSHLAIGKDFTMRVTILQAYGISSEYSDVFCQFNFMQRCDESFSTESVKNLIGPNGDGPLCFYHVQNISVSVTKAFIEYISTKPLLFEIFGHCHDQQALLNKQSSLDTSIPRSMPKHMLPPTMAVSQPVQSSRIGPLKVPNTNPVHSTFDLLVSFEVRELAPNGEYLPVVVDHDDGQPCSGIYILHQGIQRRLTITIVHDSGNELGWKDVKELLIGHIRTTPQVTDEKTYDGSVLILTPFTPQCVKKPDEDRTYYRIDAPWDSSMHNSQFLNSISAYGERVYLTVTAYLQIENCSQPAILSKDLCVVIHGRDSRATSAGRSIRNIFSGSTFKYSDINRVTGVYELILRETGEQGSPGAERRQRKILDTSSAYVRGEENLRGWRPRSDSLIFEHQWTLEKFRRLQDVECTRYWLALTSRQRNPTANLDSDWTMESNQALKRKNSKSVELDEREKALLTKYVKLIKYTGPSKVAPPRRSSLDIKTPSSDESSGGDMSASVMSLSSVLSSHSQPSITSAGGLTVSQKPPRSISAGNLASLTEQGGLVPDAREVRINPVVSKRSYINFLEGNTNGWVKRWVVVRRPYALIYRNEKDPVERGLINLTTSRVEYSEDTQAMLKVPNTLSVITPHRGFLMQTPTEQDLQEWLYAINPLYASPYVPQS